MEKTQAAMAGRAGRLMREALDNRGWRLVREVEAEMGEGMPRTSKCSQRGLGERGLRRCGAGDDKDDGIGGWGLHFPAME